MSAIAIFVKTPGLSPVKTRLAQAWSQTRAEHFHQLAAAAVQSLCEVAAIGPIYWAVAEPRSIAQDHWPGLPIIEQGHGGLGERMARVHSELVKTHGAALLLGADSPQVNPDDLIAADRWLQRDLPSLCIGPSSDGGFWTIGANRVLPTADWQGVSYSQSNTRDQFLARTGNRGQWLTLPTLTDLDRAEDMPALIEQLKALPQATQAQRSLLAWLRNG
jgi:uncharacterized protein